MVEVTNVSKTYGEKTVLEKTSVVIPKGKITSFMSPNGAGKMYAAFNYEPSH